MQPLAFDTPLAIEQRQIEAIRQQTPAERLASTFDLTIYVYAAARAAIRRAQPGLTPLDRARLLMEITHGPAAAAQLSVAPQEDAMLSPAQIPAVVVPVVAVFEELGIAYCIAGSLAASAWAMPRSTNDVAIFADVRPGQIAALVARLGADYYIAAAQIREAIEHHGSFNLIHNATSFRVDVFLPDGSAYDRMQLARARTQELPFTTRSVKISSPEDVVLRKLRWYLDTQGARDSQWSDVQAVLRVQGEAIDRAYLERWAPDLGIKTLLQQALRGERPTVPPADPKQQSFF